MFLIDDILLSPLKGIVWLGKKINEVAEKEFSDEGLIKEKLMAQAYKERSKEMLNIAKSMDDYSYENKLLEDY